MSKSSKLALAALAAVGVVWGAWWLWARPTPRSVAVRLVQAVRTGDADAMWPYVSDGERRQFGLTRERFRAVLVQFVTPTFAALGTPARTRLEPDAGVAGAWGAGAEYRRADGVAVGYGVDVLPGPHGPLAKDLLSGLVMGALRARAQQVDDRFGYAREARGIEQYAPELERLGMPGMMWTHDQVDTFTTWEDRLALVKHRRDVLLGKATRGSDE